MLIGGRARRDAHVRVRERRRRGEVGRLCGRMRSVHVRSGAPPVCGGYAARCGRVVWLCVCGLFICYNMYNTICKEFSHTAIISRTCSHLSGTDSATRGLQAARQLRSKSHSFRRETRRAGRFVMLATVRGHHVSERNDEKVPIFQRRPFILWDESPPPPRPTQRVTPRGCLLGGRRLPLLCQLCQLGLFPTGPPGRT